METDQQADSAFIAASLSSPREFGEIFERHYNAVHAYLGRRVGVAADELTGAVFEAAFAFRRTYDLERRDALPWLYGISAKLVAQHLRREGRRRRAYQRATNLRPDHYASVDEFAEIENRLDADGEHIRLQEALSYLRPGDRDALLLHVWEELSCAEVGRALKIPEGTVRSRVHRARRRMRERLAVTDQCPLNQT